MFKVLLFIIFVCFSYMSNAMSYTSYPVPIYKNNLPMASSLYLKLKTTPIDLLYSDFKKTAKNGDDLLFVSTMDSMLNKDIKTFEKIIKSREGLESDQQNKNYLNTFNKMYDGFKNLTVISKIQLKKRIIYVWSVDVNGHKIATGHFFVKVGGQYKYKDFDSISDVETLIKQVVVKSYFLPKIFNKKVNIKRHYEVELEDDDLTDIGAYFQFDGHFDYVTKESQGYLFTQNTKDAEQSIKQVFLFYDQMKKNLNESNSSAFFKGLSKKSIRRLGGNTKGKLQQNSVFLENQLLPETLVFSLDAKPFNIVFGTHFSNEFGNVIAEKNQTNRSKLMSKIPFIYNYLLSHNGKDPIVVSALYTGYLDRVFKKNNFIARKLITPLVN